MQDPNEEKNVWEESQQESQQEKELRGILEKLVKKLSQAVSPPKAILDPAQPRSKVKALEIRISIQSESGEGNRVQGQWRIARADGEPFDRIDQQLREEIHGDLDRYLDDLNRLWDQLLKDNPYITLETLLGNGMPVMKSSLQDGLPEHRMIRNPPVPEPQGDGDGGDGGGN